MMYTPISVVIPAYNEEILLPLTLKGLFVQQKMPDEVIVVNNASTDKTEQVAKSFIQKFKAKGVILKVINEPIKGVARARNRGFNAAKHEIIASTDADSQPHSDWIKQIEHHFANFDSIAVTGTIIAADAPVVIKFITRLGWFGFINLAGKILFGFRGVHTANGAIRKKYFKKVGGFDELIISPVDGLMQEHDDFEISSRLVLLGNISFDSSIVVNSSFRRYSSFKKAFVNFFRRWGAWQRTSRRYKAQLNQ